jgi:hypothetical protein
MARKFTAVFVARVFAKFVELSIHPLVAPALAFRLARTLMIDRLTHAASLRNRLISVGVVSKPHPPHLQ